LRPGRPLATASLLATALCLASCGGGGGGSTGGDVRPDVVPAAPEITGPNIFLLFPNPQQQPDGTQQTNTEAYVRAYYAAIDPDNRKDTLDKWKAANGFGAAGGSETGAVFGDVRDLGYGRRMTARRNDDGTIAFTVENYLVEVAAGYAYSPFNLNAAVARDTRWHIGTNAIEYSPGPNGGVPFAKFFNFNAKTGERAQFVDLDGRGEKAMPGPCITCHGGRGDPLTPPDANGRQLFNLVANSVSQARGDVQARLHAFEPDTFDFSSTPGYTRAEQEAAFKTMNKWILCTYPIPAPTGLPEDACRRVASVNEWQGTAAEHVKAAYGGDGMPNATYSDNYVPQSWLANGQSTLYKEVQAQACRACHELRGTGNQSDVDFEAYEKFAGYSDRIKAHIVDRGNMPLARLVSDKFYATGMPELIANFLAANGYLARDTSGAVLKPGRPIADPGPGRVTRPGATPLSAAGSLYATSYQWSLVSGPAGASLANAGSAQATFTAGVDGTYVVQLVASAGATRSTPAQLTIVVDSQLTPAPSAIRFADIKAVLQSASAGCTNAGCHSVSTNPVRAPLLYTEVDRNGDGVTGDATDDRWFHAEVRGRVNFTDLAASNLLRKPSGHHHKGELRPGFTDTEPPGSALRANYDLFLNWILNGAPL
jgi:mono/diheme cytochrome c family protein